MPQKSQEKCANVDCNCKAEPGSAYCSATCQEMGGQTVTHCPCGHAECATAARTGGAMSGGNW
jgi:hypothetical protein